MKDEIYDYGERLRRYRRIIAGFGNYLKSLSSLPYSDFPHNNLV